MKLWKIWIGCIAVTLVFAAISRWSADKVQQYDKPILGITNQCVWDDPDDGMWVRYAQDAANGGVWKMKWASHDNQPFGRPNHWSSIPVVGLRLLGEIRKMWTHEPTPVAIERAAVWWNPLLMLLGGAGLSWILLRLADKWGAAIYMAMLTNPEFTGALNGLHPDHQGLILLLGCTFALTSAGAMLNPKSKWWISQGITAGALLAISPMNAYPYLLAFGLAWTIVALTDRTPFIPLDRVHSVLTENHPQHGADLRKAGWLAGAVTAAGWAMEYWPHWAYQVEAVTWMHALAIIAGFHAICVLLALKGSIPKSRGDVGITLLGMLPLTLMVIVMGREAISTSYPEMKRLCWDIVELQSPGKNYPAGHWLWLGTTLATLTLAIQTKTRPMIWAATLTITCGLFWGMTTRLQPIATVAGFGAALVCLMPILEIRMRSWLQAALILASVTWTIPTMTEWKGVADGQLQPPMHTLYRQMKTMAATINADAKIHGPNGVLFPDPGRAATLAYYLDGKVGTTVYWENIEGLLNAIEILASEDEEVAKKTLSDKFFGYIILTRPEYLQGLIRAGGANRNGTSLADYTGGRWMLNRPNWLIEIAPGINRVDREKLQLELPKK